MAKCGICDGDVETNAYVRAKELVAAGEVRGRPRYVPSPSGEHAFFCLIHGREAVEEAIAAAFAPAQGKPVRVLFNPGKHDFRMAARRQRVVETLQRAFGQMPTERMFVAMLDDEDARRGVNVTRKKGLDGLRSIVVQDRAALHLGLAALLGEPEGAV